MRNYKRVYCCGSQGVGTTTWAALIQRHWGYYLIPDAVRKIANEEPRSLDQIRNDPEAKSRFQIRVFQKQVALEHGLSEFVSDQAFDNIAYALQFTPIGEELLHSPYVRNYVGTLDSDDVIIFYFEPHPDMMVDDGFRARSDLKFENVVRTDGVIFALINFFRLMKRTEIVSTDVPMKRLKKITDKLGIPKHPIRFDILWEEALDYLPDRNLFENMKEF